LNRGQLVLLLEIAHRHAAHAVRLTTLLESGIVEFTAAV